MLDIDFFKQINDTYGHDVGDIAIKNIATVIYKILDEKELVARFGGEEFCILIENKSKEYVAEKFREIRMAFEENIITVKDITFSYTVSIGVCYGLNDSLEIFLKSADNALYKAKESGRNRVVIEHNG